MPLIEARRILPDAVVGVGTVRTTEHVKAATEAGAVFAVSQFFLPELVAAATECTDPLRAGHSDPNRGDQRVEHRGPRGQGVPDRPARRGHLSARAARADARRRDHAHRRSDVGGRRRVPRRGRGRGRSQRRVAGGRPARRRSRRAESASPQLVSSVCRYGPTAVLGRTIHENRIHRPGNHGQADGQEPAGRRPPGGGQFPQPGDSRRACRRRSHHRGFAETDRRTGRAGHHHAAQLAGRQSRCAGPGRHHRGRRIRAWCSST